MAVHAPWESGYLRVTDRDDEEWADNKQLNGTSPFAITHPDNNCELARVDPPKGVEPVTRDITLDPGWDFSGTVLGPDGDRLSGARGFVSVLNESHSWDYGQMKEPSSPCTAVSRASRASFFFIILRRDSSGSHKPRRTRETRSQYNCNSARWSPVACSMPKGGRAPTSN